MLWWTLRQLKSGRAETRIKAARKIADLRDVRAIGPLTVALKDKHTRVREIAAEGLGSIGNSEAIGRLLTALNDPAAGVRQTAANVFVRMRDPQTLEPLMASLSKGDPMTGELTISTLDSIDANWRKSTLGKAAVETYLQCLASSLRAGDFSNRCATVTQMMEFAGDHLEALVASIKDAGFHGRQELLKRLGEVAPGWADTEAASTAVPSLVKALTSDDSDTREGAAHILEKIGNVNAVGPLLRALEDEEPRVRHGASVALGSIGDLSAVEPLIGLLRDRDGFARTGALSALGKLRDVRAISALADLLRGEEDSMQRRYIVEAVGEIGGAEAVGPLVAELVNKDAGVRFDAETALKKVDPNWATSEGARSAVPALIAALEDWHREARKSAVQVLGQIRDTRALEPLVAALDVKNSDVSLEAAEALEKLGWESPDEAVREKIRIQRNLAWQKEKINMLSSRGLAIQSWSAEQIRCPYCSEHNFFSWPPKGDSIPYYIQTSESTTEGRQGAYNIKEKCAYCERDFYVAWDDDPL